MIIGCDSAFGRARYNRRVRFVAPRFARLVARLIPINAK
jgi:hypothetical protein